MKKDISVYCCLVMCQVYDENIMKFENFATSIDCFLCLMPEVPKIHDLLWPERKDYLIIVGPHLTPMGKVLCCNFRPYNPLLGGC